MDVPDPEKVAALIALLAFGLAAREGFYSRVQRRKEEAGQTVLWAVIWSAPLKLLFDAFNRKPFDLWGLIPTKTLAQATALAFLYNFIFSYLIGFMLGSCYAGFSDWRRHRKRKESKIPFISKVVNSEPYKRIAQFVSGTTPRIDLSQEWLRKCGSQEWILVETIDNRFILGWLSFYDLSQDRATDMHIVLGEPGLLNLSSNVPDEPFAKEIMLPMSQIRNIRTIRANDEQPIEKPVTVPEPKQEVDPAQ